MLITRAHVNDPCFRQIEESVPHSPLMIMGSPEGVVLPDNASSSDIATFQRQLELRCKSTFGVEQVFAHGDVALCRVSAQEMIPAPTAQQFDYGFSGWADDVAIVAAGAITIVDADGNTAPGPVLALRGSGNAYMEDGKQSIWENHQGQYYDAFSYLEYCVYPVPCYVRYDILSCYTHDGRMTNPHHDSPPARGYGHKMFYPNGPSRLSLPSARFSEDVPLPLCDYPRYANMMLLRNSQYEAEIRQ